MPIDGLLFTRIGDELKNSLQNARVQAVYQPASTELVIHLRQPGRTHLLLISIDPALARVHLTQEEPENPLAPPAFCLLLRKYLIPGRIVDVRQPPFERILELRIEGRDDEGEPTERSLYVEIMGRHSNVILVRSDGLIVDAMKRVPQELNRYREILPNRPYVPPPAQERVHPDRLTEEELGRMIRLVPAQTRPARVLAEHVAGFSPLAGREVVARAGLPLDVTREELKPGDLAALWRSFSEVMEAVRTGRSRPTAVTSGDKAEFWLMPLKSVEGEAREFDSVQEMLDWVYARRAAHEAFQRRHQALARSVEQHLRRVERKVAAQRQELQEADLAEEHRIAGDLITAYLHQISPGTSRVELPNFYEDGAPVILTLDPALSPAANAQAYYRKYQKAKKRLVKAKEQLDASLEEMAYLESVKTALRYSQSPEELREIHAELVQSGYMPEGPRERSGQSKKDRGSQGLRSGRPGAASSPLSLRSSDGFAILVGRNNRQNDLLTMGIARDDDIWLHAKEIPGAHVIIQTQGQEVPDTTLVEAAAVAAFFSQARESANVPVDYTRRKHVRKPKGARPGMVIYDHQRTLFVTPDRELIKRLGGDEQGSNAASDRG